jgi:hypothetical protein
MPTIGNVTSIAEIAAKIAQTFAFAIGGFWVLMNYVLDRIHVRRLQLELLTKLEEQSDFFHLVVTISVRNPGRANTMMTQEGSAFSICRLTNYDNFMKTDNPNWEYIHMFDIFIMGREESKKFSIEPGITVKEEQLVLLPLRSEIYLMVLRVRSTRRFRVFPRRTWTYAKMLKTSPIASGVSK